VIKPLVAPGMKEDLHTAGQWIDPSEVGTFMEVAAVACQSKIVGIIGPAGPAILALPSSPLANEPPDSGIYRY
jgi:hypothetical protein